MAASVLRRDDRRELCDACSHFYECYSKGFYLERNFYLGSFYRLDGRTYCALCRLLSTYLDAWQYTPHLDSQIILSPRFDTEELAILCPNPHKSKPLGWLRLVSVDEKLPIDNPSLSRGPDCGFGAGQIFFDQVRCWLASCGFGDKHIAQGVFGPKVIHSHLYEIQKLVDRNINPRNMVLIDVIDQNLVIGRLDVDFVAMSYVWGDYGRTAVAKTTKESLDRLCRQGGLKELGESIPRVVHDAMAFVRGIGQRYLWCDLLCVVSDDADVRNSQIEMMDAIYSEASLTIIALTGSHSNMGLPGVTPGSRKPICFSETLQNGVRFFIRHVSLTSFYDQTIYTTRGWTFQEELLSRRCLYVTDRQMYFKCSKSCHREDDFLFNRSDDAVVDSCLYSFPAGYERLANAGQDFNGYCNLLSEYNRRILSLDTDILKAFDGITSVLARNYQCEFFQGLPTRFLAAALLWIPSEHITRRFQTIPSQTQTGTPPTWSWAAWKGCISHLWSNDPFAQSRGRLVPSLAMSSHSAVKDWMIGSTYLGNDNLQSSFLPTLRFLSQVRRILSGIGTNGSTEDIKRELMQSGLNNGGWSTEPPTDAQALYAVRSVGSFTSSYAQEASSWPFSHMKCLHPHDSDNWWPSNSSVPTPTDISRALQDSQLAEQILTDFGRPFESNPPLRFVASNHCFDDHFNFNGGQLSKIDDGTLGSTFTTRNGNYDCNLETMEFTERKDPLPSRITWSSTPATAFFAGEGHSPCGILYDFEADIRDRTQTESGGTSLKLSLLLISITSAWNSNLPLLGVMLVREIGDGYERVAVGRMFGDYWPESFRVFEDFWPKYSDQSWIRLY